MNCIKQKVISIVKQISFIFFLWKIYTCISIMLLFVHIEKLTKLSEEVDRQKSEENMFLSPCAVNQLKLH